MTAGNGFRVRLQSVCSSPVLGYALTVSMVGTAVTLWVIASRTGNSTLIIPVVFMLGAVSILTLIGADLAAGNRKSPTVDTPSPERTPDA